MADSSVADHAGANLNLRAGSVAAPARFGRFRSRVFPERNAPKPAALPIQPIYGLRENKLAVTLSPLLIFAAWFALSESGLFPQEVLVPPQTVALSMWGMIQSGDLQHNVLSSLGRLFTGYAIGAGIGILLGSLIGMSRTVQAYIQPMFQILRQLPTIALIPAFIMILGVGETVKIVLVAIAVALPVALATSEGIRGIPRVYFDVSGVYRVRRWQLLRKVVLPATVPPILTGMRLALSRSWVVLVGAELLIADNGIGQMLEWGREIFRLDIVLGGVVITGVIGFTLDKLFRLVERRLVRWQYR